MQNNLEINESQKLVENIIKKASDKNVPIDERDRESHIKTLNARLQELQDALKKIEESEKEYDDKKANLDKKIDNTDDDKAETDKKIKRLEEQIALENIDKEDKSNPIVKRLNSALEEREALNEMTDSYQNESKKLDEEKENNTSTKNEIMDEIKVIEKAKTNINNKMLSNKVEQASKNAKEKAERNTSHERDPFLVLLDSFFKRLHNIRERDKMIADAQNGEATNQDKIESRYSVKESGDDIIVENSKPEEKENNDACVSLVISDKVKDTTQVKILTPEEYVAFTNTEEGKGIRSKLKQEAELPEKDRTLSFVQSFHENKTALLDKIKSFMPGTDNPQDIGQYANSLSRRNNLISTISDDAKDTRKLGGNSLDEQFKFSMTQDQETVTPTSLAKKEQPNLNIHETVASDTPNKVIEKDDIPWEQLKSFNINKNSLSKENIDALRNHASTDIITVKGKNKKGDEVEQSFKLTLSNDEDGKLTFRKMPVLPKNNVDKRQKIGDIEFTKEDKEMLKKYGQLNHLVPFTSEDGKTKMLMVGLDSKTNTLFTCDPNKVKLPKFFTEQCTKEELRKIRSGQPVHVENLKDNAGQKFNGWVVMSPHNNGNILHLKHIDKEFIPQVRNNNYGERTELLKEDKDPMVMTKQRESNDGEKPKVETSQRKALDFSVDNNGTKTEHDKTIKTTKHNM